jgi:dynein heavy chain
MKMMESIDKICKAPVMEISFVCRVIMTLNLLNGILKPLVQSNKTLTE